MPPLGGELWCSIMLFHFVKAGDKGLFIIKFHIV
jgi:hypothetical protein